MLIETSKLAGASLDWAVAKCEGWNPQWDEVPEDFFLPDCHEFFTHLREFHPSTNWAQGGPLIERMYSGNDLQLVAMSPTQVRASVRNPMRFNYGPTPLVAAMRCYVASKLGEKVYIPEVLCLS